MFVKKHIAAYFFLLLIAYTTSCIADAEKNIPLAFNILSSINHTCESEYSIFQTEYDELQCKDLCATFDRTQTSFGLWGLHNLLLPLNNKKVVLKRQQLIQLCMQDDELYDTLKNMISLISSFDSTLLHFFDTQDPIKILSSSLYFQYPVIKKVNNYLNNSIVALQGLFLSNIGSNILYMIGLLCLQGLQNECMQWMLNDKSTPLNIIQGLKNGLTEPIMQHSFALTDYFKERKKSLHFKGWTFKDHCRAATYGSLGDRYDLAKNGYAYGASVVGLPHNNIVADGLSSTGAFLFAAIPIGFFDFIRINQIVNVFKNMRSSYTLVNHMHEKMIVVQKFLSTIEKIMDYITHYKNGILLPLMPQELFLFLKNRTKQMDSLITLLHTSTFKKSSTHFYSRGKVLRAYNLFNKVKKECIPLFQSIGILDGYLSIIQSFKQFQLHNLPVCLAHHDTSSSTHLIITDGWCPLIDPLHVVVNDVQCGASSHPLKMIITGPNGCGKSSYLKMIGHTVILAHSVGIVPAKECKTTFFNTISTSLHPEEDVLKGLSTYMAQAQSMERTQSCIQSCNHLKKAIVLVDEPYRGTVEAESSTRIVNFCNTIADNTDCVVAIATHVKEPTTLASTELFSNYHVEIQQASPTKFLRTFKIIPGYATWWFDNTLLRKQFVDWISLQS